MKQEMNLNDKKAALFDALMSPSLEPVVCDFSGTLTGRKDNGSHNFSLLKILCRLKDNGSEIQMASTDPGSSSMAFTWVALEADIPPEALGDICNKKDLSETEASIVFDDKKPDYLKDYDIHFDMSDLDVLKALDELATSLPDVSFANGFSAPKIA